MTANKISKASRIEEPTRTPLNPQRILTAAVTLMDRGGLAAFSMRKLGADLNVEAMSLYNHFPNKTALLDAAATLLFETIRDVGAEQTDGLERMRAVMRATYRLVEEHPCFIDLLFHSRSGPQPSEQRDADLAALRSVGFSETEAEFALQSLISFVVGFLYQGGLTLPEQRDAGFEFGLDLILDGLRRKISQRE